MTDKIPSQRDQLKDWFDAGKSLTVAEALTQFGIYALSQRVGELIRDGYPIDSERITLPSGKSVSKYSKLKIAY